MPRLLLWLILLLPWSALAQFNTPSNDGTLDANTYGGTGNPNNYVSGGQTWYMTWDDTNIYFFVTNANVAEGAVIYLDINPIVPVNAGTNSDGSLSAQVYDGSGTNPPFRADAVIYAKNGYREIRLTNGSGGWGGANTAWGNFSSSGSNREFSVPWNAITGSGRPSAFNWFGYITSSGGVVYGQIPSLNASGSIGTSANYSRYLSVISTASGQDGASPNPAIGRESYTFLGGSDITSFGAVALHDMTVNNSGRFLSRGSGGGNWTIGGTLVVGAGTLYFGSSGSFGTTSVGSVRVMGGTLDMDATNQAMTVSDSVYITSGVLKLSNISGGDINLRGNWRRSGGTFMPNSRAVGFISTTRDQIVWNAETFDYLSVNKTGHKLVFTAQTDVTTGFAMTAGNIDLNGHLFVLGADTGSSAASVTYTSGLLYGGTVRRYLHASTPTNLVVPMSNGTDVRNVTLSVLSGGNDFGCALDIEHIDYGMGTLPGIDGVTIFPLVGGQTISSVEKLTNFVWRIRPAGSALPSEDMTFAFRFDGAAAVSSSANLCVLRREFSPDYGAYSALTFAGVSWTGTLTPMQVTTLQIDPSIANEVIVGNGGSETLPVTWLQLNARRHGTTARVEWSTASELNNAFFEVERSRSSSLVGAEVVGQVTGRGTTQSVSSYQLTDAEVGAGEAYYRIRQVDIDGKAQYSPTVRLSEANEGAEWLVYPTVVDDRGVNLVKVGESTEALLQLISAEGRMVWQGHGTPTELARGLNAALSIAGAGLYVVQLTDGARRSTHRVMRY